MKNAVFDIGHAGCVSCKRAIEHAGRRLEGVDKIEVDISSHCINLAYDEEHDNVKEELKELVSRIGYEAELVSDSPSAGD